MMHNKRTGMDVSEGRNGERVQREGEIMCHEVRGEGMRRDKGIALEVREGVGGNGRCWGCNGRCWRCNGRCWGVMGGVEGVMGGVGGVM